MQLTLMQIALAIGSGSVVGLSLGLVGGGGSILAVPLLVYVVGLHDPHVAIGTSAVAVALNAASSLATHARSGNVRWRHALIFATAGIAGAYLGSTLGKMVNGQRLLGLFAILMMVVALLMLRNHRNSNAVAKPRPDNIPKLGGYGVIVGGLSGFFGIGGGFLIVPALVAATGMPMLHAIGSSLVSVTAFGLTTAGNYAASGLVDWWVSALFVMGGIVGGVIGTRAAKALSTRRGALTYIFAGLIFVVAVYMLIRSVA